MPHIQWLSLTDQPRALQRLYYAARMEASDMVRPEIETRLVVGLFSKVGIV